VTPPEVEQHLRIDKLRREVDAMARRSVAWLVAACVAAFVLGVAIGRVWR
jgi:hypothetical protein